MENWQLTLVILASVLVGAMLPLLIMVASAAYRVGREIAEIGARLKRTLTQVEVISDRVEILSRGFEGGEATIAELLATVGQLASGLDRNMKTINLISTLVASVGTAVAAYVGTRYPDVATATPVTPDAVVVPANGSPPGPAAGSSGATGEAH